MEAPVLCEVLRSNNIASLHRGHIAVADKDGRLLFSSGVPRFRTHARSVLKPLQLLAVVESGAADTFSLSPEELAVMAGSHSGSARHTETVARVLEKIGLDENSLECGVHHPIDVEEGKLIHEGKRRLSKLHNNCSGKHAGMLVTCRHKGWEHRGYVAHSHPLHELVLGTAAAVMGLGPVSSLELAVDGCGLPTPYVELKSLAVGFARLATSSGGVAATGSMARVADAMVGHPYLVAGTGRLCTAIMTALKGNVVAKGGGEAVYCVASRKTGVGLCVKIEDGTFRAVGPAVIEAMRQLGMVEESHLNELAEFRTPQMKNCREEVVGQIRPSFRLEEIARAD